MGFYPVAVAGGLVKVADSGDAGFALQNATPTIISWTVPNDGNLHAFEVCGAVVVSSAETGGAIQVNYQPPTSGVHTATLDAGGHGSAGTSGFTQSGGVAAPGSVVSITQNTALTGGAAVTFCQIYGN
jgi:hypothetical protein